MTSCHGCGPCRDPALSSRQATLGKAESRLGCKGHSCSSVPCFVATQAFSVDCCALFFLPPMSFLTKPLGSSGRERCEPQSSRLSSLSPRSSQTCDLSVLRLRRERERTNWIHSQCWLFVQLFGSAARHTADAARRPERKPALGIKRQADLPFDWPPDCVSIPLDLDA